jgi:hypothetical protein
VSQREWERDGAQTHHVAVKTAINVEESKLALLQPLVDRSRGMRKGGVGTKKGDDSKLLEPTGGQSVGDELR